MKLNTATYLIVWGYIVYSIGALFFYFSKLFYDILVPAHLVATIAVFSLFYYWRRQIADEDEHRRSVMLSWFLVPIVIIYAVIYFMMFSQLV